MRPDQHKQKKNSQYKRKHGISQKKETVQDKTETKRSGRPKDEDCHPNEKGDLKSHPNQDVTDSDKDIRVQTDPVYEKKTFHRRQIVSNWNQYTLPDESENQSQSKGEDFSILLETAGVSQAQFRFRDEQDWESDVPCLTEAANILSLDCDVLAAAVKCIPVHDRLKLDEELFSKEQVDLFVQDANKCEYIYKELSSGNGRHDHTVNLTSLTLKSSERETNFTAAASPSSEHTLSVDTTIKDNVDFTNSLRNKAVDSTLTKGLHIDGSKGVKPSHTNKGNESVGEKEAEQKQSFKSLERLKPFKIESSNEDELDFLLSMETPKSKGAVVSMETPKSKGAVVSMETPKSKGAVVSMETSMSKGAVVSTPSSKSVDTVKETQLQLEIKPDESSSSQPTKPIKIDKQDSLEDWLDSMLDN